MAWGMQEISAGDLHGAVQAGGGNTRKAPSAATNEAVVRAAMGQSWRKEGAKEVGGKKLPAKPRECGAMTGSAMPQWWPTSKLEWGTMRVAKRPTEWRKTHGGPTREWTGVSNRHRATTARSD